MDPSANAMSLRASLRAAMLLLLDFDGPVAAVFANLPARGVAEALRRGLSDQGVVIPPEPRGSNDPLDVLRWASTTVDANLISETARQLTHFERQAMRTATPTPGAEALLRAAREAQLPVHIVSNNSADAIADYLDQHRLASLVTAVHGRPVGHVSRMKPDPWLLLHALDETGTPADASVLLGDSVSDVQAARAAGVPCIGLANKPGKRDNLAAAGASVIVDSVLDVVDAM